MTRGSGRAEVAKRRREQGFKASDLARDRLAAVLKRAEDAGRAAFHASLAPGESRGVWKDPPDVGSSEQLRKYLATSDELRGVDSTLNRRQAYEEYMSSLDWQLAEVEKTRQMIAACQPRNPPATVREPTPQLALPAPAEIASSSSSPTLAEAGARCMEPRTKPAPAVVELRPMPCPSQSVGDDCPCCLSVLQSSDVIMCFPCPAEHVFHSHCLTKWLRSAGTRSRCPMCRAWPKPKRVSPAQRRAPRPAIRSRAQALEALRIQSLG